MNDIEKRFYEFMNKNTIPSSLNRSASALEKLNANTEALTNEIKNANSSSTKLSKSLNLLTLAAVIIAALALALEGYKLWQKKNANQNLEPIGTTLFDSVNAQSPQAHVCRSL